MMRSIVIAGVSSVGGAVLNHDTVKLWREAILDPSKPYQALPEKYVAEEEEATAHPRVFISYSWDSDQHKTEVLNLAKSLRRNGVDCIIDCHHEIPPPEIGWYLWMKKQIQTSKFVLVVCTEKYLKRYDKEEESGKGQGVAWEGGVITAELYENQGKNKKFIPVVLSSTANSSQSIIPIELRSTNFYCFANKNYNRLENQVYEKLLRHLFNEPATPVSELGSRPLFSNPKQSNWAVQTVSTSELLSEKGIDYTTLRDLLKDNKWKEADRETYLRMLEAVERNDGDWIREKELRNFPSADLQTIDRLWVQYSNGHFGFSVQKKIWQECGSPTSRGKDLARFCIKVGWKNSTEIFYVSYSELKFDPAKSSVGELPRGGFWTTRFGRGWGLGSFGMFFVGITSEYLEALKGDEKVSISFQRKLVVVPLVWVPLFSRRDL